MSNDVIFYTQLASIIAFIVALFLPYKVLVAQKDASIELLRHEIDTLKRKLSDAESKSPDILVNVLSSRVEISEKEILRLKQDGDTHQTEIDEKETQLHHLKRNLSVLQELLEDSELVCPKCKGDTGTVYGTEPHFSESTIKNRNAVCLNRCDKKQDNDNRHTLCYF